MKFKNFNQYINERDIPNTMINKLNQLAKNDPNQFFEIYYNLLISGYVIDDNLKDLHNTTQLSNHSIDLSKMTKFMPWVTSIPLVKNIILDKKYKNNKNTEKTKNITYQ